ncbi:hypothetical protein [Legionella bononiensis]|uniref:Outer membrane protein beta-barrel domain-containing protein n=1 Tax=Legionella bononiensis TaxID=2793102 RepID=A0ABS1WE14_9GAMM|nr:hypothetical protein [Legionella bononiensis]MBL7479544.1 hypothetical protein [Legionella bononiensis]MBL7527582.1 hypothetical protein [Legionella bononiensis]
MRFLKLQNVLLTLGICFIHSLYGGTMGDTHHPLTAGKWNMALDGGASYTRFSDPSKVLRLGGINLEGQPNISGVLGVGNDYYFDKLFDTHYFYGASINYAYTNNLEWGVEFEGTYAGSQRYQRNTAVGFLDQTYSKYQSFSGYLLSTFYFDSNFTLANKTIYPFVGAKVGGSYRPEIIASNDRLNGVPVTFGSETTTIFYKTSSSISGGLYMGLLMDIQDSLSAFVKVGIMASDGLLGNNLIEKMVVIRPIQRASISNSGGIISLPVMIGIKKFFE